MQHLRSSRTSPSLGTSASLNREGGTVSSKSGPTLRRSRTDSPHTTHAQTSEWRAAPKAQQFARSGTMLTTSSTTASFRRSDTISDSETGDPSSHPSPRTPFTPLLQNGLTGYSDNDGCDLPEAALNEELPRQVPVSRRPFKVLTESQRGRSLERFAVGSSGFDNLGSLPKPRQPSASADRDRSVSTDGGLSEEASRVDASDFNLFFRQTCMKRSGSNLSSRFNRSQSNLSSRLNRSASNLSNPSQRSSAQSDNANGRSREEDNASKSSDRCGSNSSDSRGRQRVKLCTVVREGTGSEDAPPFQSLDSQASLRRSCSDEAQGSRYHRGFHPFGRSKSDGVGLSGDLDFEPKLSLLPEGSEDFDDELVKPDGTRVLAGSPGLAAKQSMPFMRRLSTGLMKTIGRSQILADQVALGVGVVIFDWDDTLLPTSYIKQVVIPSLPVPDRDQTITPESHYYNELCAHAKTVEAILRAANKVATIAIVTLATKWWVQTSAERYLPGLDFEGLLSELDLVIYPADRQSAVVKAYSLSGRDPCIYAKKVAMAKCLKTIYRGSDYQWNVLSVGDSLAEREALKECLSQTGRKALCKTVKFRENLKVGELTKELQLLSPHLKTLISHKEDVDRTTANLNLRRSMWLNI